MYELCSDTTRLSSHTRHISSVSITVKKMNLFSFLIPERQAYENENPSPSVNSSSIKDPGD